MSDSLRQRARAPEPTSGKAATALDGGDSSTDAHTTSQGPISFADIIRILGTIVAILLCLSYYLTSGDSLSFDYRPWFTRVDRLKSYIRGPLYLASAELSLYNGTAYPQMPILLSINSTIFDVSASPHTYGPGGSYNIFAGRDATRAFVTGCFQEDLTGDLRGVERMYLPVDDEVEGDDNNAAEKGKQQLSSGERKIRAEQESRQAKKRVRAEVDKWVRFYRDHEKYFQVGHLLASEDRDITDDGSPRLCDSAERSRPKRSQLEKRDGEESKPISKSKGTDAKNRKPV